jgi:hypothetical protein
MKKWEGEPEINRELRRLSEEVRALRDEIHQQRLGEQGHSDDGPAATPPPGEERTLRLLPPARTRNQAS